MPFTRTIAALVVAGGLTVVPALPVVAAPPDVTPPTLTITGVKWPTFYPVVDGYKDAAEVSYQHSDDSTDPTLDVHVKITDAVGALVLERADNAGSAGSMAPTQMATALRAVRADQPRAARPGGASVRREPCVLPIRRTTLGGRTLGMWPSTL